MLFVVSLTVLLALLGYLCKGASEAATVVWDGSWQRMPS